MPKKSKKTTSTGYSRTKHLKDQKDFYKAHPNARALLMSFLILVSLLGYLYYIQFGLELMPL